MMHSDINFRIVVLTLLIAHSCRFNDNNAVRDVNCRPATDDVTKLEKLLVVL